MSSDSCFSLTARPQPRSSCGTSARETSAGAHGAPAAPTKGREPGSLNEVQQVRGGCEEEQVTGEQQKIQTPHPGIVLMSGCILFPIHDNGDVVMI